MNAENFSLLRLPGCTATPAARNFFGFFLACLLAIVGFDKPAIAVEPEPGFYDSLQKFHGHTCAGSIIGARLGLAAKAVLEREGGTGKLTARYFSHSCAVDGIQVAVGTTYGKRNIEVEDRNEHRLLLTSENGRQVEARLTKIAEKNAKTSLGLVKKVHSLPANSPERQVLQKEINKMIEWFRSSPESEVVMVTVVK